MKIFGKPMFVAAALMVSTPLEAGWQNTEWDMNSEEVEAAMGGKAPKSSGGSRYRLGDKEVGNLGEYRNESLRFRTVYYYDENGLSHVALYRRSGDCEDIAAWLLTEYGQPVRISDQAILRLVIWHDEVEQNRIRLVTSDGLCDVNYERLSDYQAIDLKKAQRQ